MTTIAWDGTTLAADRCSWSSDVRRAVKKLHRFDDGIFAGCGSGELVEAYVAYRLGKRDTMPDWKEFDTEKGCSVGVFISNDRRVFCVTNQGDLLPFEETKFAFGAGQAFAWGALEAGATAREAIEITARRSDMAALGVDEMTLDA
jgi:hypothetical protein